MRDAPSPLARPHAKRRRPPRAWGLIVSFVLVTGLLVAAGIARLTFVLIAPHTVFPPVATLSREKRAQLDEELEIDRPFDRDQAIDFALDFTAESLSLALSPAGRSPSFDFNVGKRKGGSAEYAALFVAVFEAASKRAGSTARAWRVSSPVRVFGRVVPLKGLGDHDWVLVHDPADGARIYLDPTLADAWVGSSLTRNVKGGEEIALKAPPEGGDEGAKSLTGDTPAKAPGSQGGPTPAGTQSGAGGASGKGSHAEAVK